MKVLMATTEHISDERASLENFICGNHDLIKLESLLSRFNIFEALGVTSRELNHSRFLGFLLNPIESHGLGDLFLKRFLQLALKCSAKPPISPIDIDTGDFGLSEILFEYENIDVLISDESNRLVVVIENKTNSQEHSDQLKKYYELVSERFPTYRLLGIYITRERLNPTHPGYVAISHEDIKELVKEVLQRPGLHLDQTVQVAIQQYLEVLGRHFMQDNEISELCRKIYRHHRKAIDLIIANKPDKRDLVQELAHKLINSETGLIADDSSRPYIRFASQALDHPFLKGTEEKWTSSKRLVLYEFRNGSSSLSLIVQLGRGDQSKRKLILDMALGHGKPFKAEKKLYTQWNRLYKFDILDESDYELSDRECADKITEKWQEFLQTDFPVIENAFGSYEWPL